MALDLDTVHSEMLAQVPDAYQKTQGFPAYDFLRAFALAVLSLDSDITKAEEHLDPDNLTGQDLDTYISQHRGLDRKYATFATATLKITAGGGSIQAGDLFATASGVEFQAVVPGTYSVNDTFDVRASLGGASGNVGANTITVMPVTIAGISSVTNLSPASGGYDAESDDDYRDRFYADLRNPSNGANQAAYIEWATSVLGVGRAKVFPQQYGANTLELCIIAPDTTPASQTVIDAVQDAIDPNENGDGSGLAPIGAACTVTTATTLTVNFAATITLSGTKTLQEVTETARAAFVAYFKSLAFQSLTISYSKVSALLSDIEGVNDHTGLTLNGSSSNITIGARQTPAVGTVVFT